MEESWLVRRSADVRENQRGKDNHTLALSIWKQHHVLEEWLMDKRVANADAAIAKLSDGPRTIRYGVH